MSKSSAGVNNINAEEISGLAISLPSLPEQTEIVKRVESLFAMADSIEERYKAARVKVGSLEPALLAKAFRGELVAQDPNDESASVLLERIKADRAAHDEKPARQSRAKNAALLAAESGPAYAAQAKRTRTKS